ncbi:uncharacterized protein A4U43_C06F13560, partial [Asparagus officinalis]
NPSPISSPTISRRHKTRLHIGQLVKDTSAKLKQVSKKNKKESYQEELEERLISLITSLF